MEQIDKEYKYDFAVSLGSFCGPASSLEKINMRNFSMPFDWIATPYMRTIVDLINNNFKDFLLIDNLKEDFRDERIDREFPTERQVRNIYYDIIFAHGFLLEKSIEEQLDDITHKYNRRIIRFFKAITKPTLFLRYIQLGDVNKDIEYINNNYELIENTFKKFNPENHVLYIINKKYKDFINTNTDTIFINTNQAIGSLDMFTDSKELTNYIKQVKPYITNEDKAWLNIV